MLTRRQHDLLVFIRDYMEAHEGLCPSHQEMADGLGIVSHGSVNTILTILENKEYIRRAAHKSRSIEILKSPEGAKVGRRKFTPAETVEIIVRQMREGSYTQTPDPDRIEYTTLACALSGDPILPGDEIILEHMTAKELGGADDVTNVRIVLKKHADTKTNVGLNSDKKRIAKVKRLQNPKKSPKKRERIGHGGKCPKCGKKMARYRHGDGWRPRDGHDWFRYWDVCRSCRHVQHYEGQRVSASGEVVKV